MFWDLVPSIRLIPISIIGVHPPNPKHINESQREAQPQSDQSQDDSIIPQASQAAPLIFSMGCATHKDASLKYWRSMPAVKCTRNELRRL